jgi:hypothetical protein
MPAVNTSTTLPGTLKHLARQLGLDLSAGTSNLATKVRPSLLRRIAPTAGEKFRFGAADQADALASLMAKNPELTGGLAAAGGAGLTGGALYQGLKG